MPAFHFVVLMCPDPVAPDNGGVSFTGNSVGDTATYTCDTGFELVGVSTVTCTAAPDGNSASFQPAAPVCNCKKTCYNNY